MGGVGDFQGRRGSSSEDGTNHELYSIWHSLEPTKLCLNNRLDYPTTSRPTRTYDACTKNPNLNAAFSAMDCICAVILFTTNVSKATIRNKVANNQISRIVVKKKDYGRRKTLLM